MSLVIEGVGLHKSFVRPRSYRDMLVHPLQRAERVQALRGVDLSVRKGDIFGLLGPNGAGKTTLLKIFSCLVLPDQGAARIGGFDTNNENEVKRQIGLVHSDERSFYWRLSGRENLRFFARLYDVPPASTESRIDELMALVDMSHAVDRPFSGYSSGMKQRMAIARAMLHDPPILLMDEPTRSLDPASALDLRTFIHDQLKVRDGKTILIASHNLREVEALSDRVAILIRGRVRHEGTVDEIRRWGIEGPSFALQTDPDATLPDGPFRALHDETADGTRMVTIALDDDTRLDGFLRLLLDAGVPVHSCDRVELDLEDAFSRIIESERESE